MNTDNSFLDALTCKGVLVSVSIRYWRGRRKLEPSDLGLKTEQIDPRLISLGQKRLLPKENFEPLALIESRAHAAVEDNTFPFLNGLARYLPNAKLETVLARLHELKQEFQDAEAKFMAQYAVHRARSLDDWRQMAAKLTANPDAQVRIINGLFPPPDAMPRLFGFEIHTFQIAAPEISQAAMIEAGTQSELIEVRREAALNARREIETYCREFISDCVATLREQTSKLCAEMLETIRTSGSVHQKTLNRLRNFIEQFGELNFCDDISMERQLDAMRKEFLTHTAEEYRGSQTARQRLVEGLTALRQTAADMATQDSRELVDTFGQLGKRRFSLAA